MIYLCDTCVLIDYLRGKTEVQQKLEQDKGLGLGMSSITYMELIVGATALEYCILRISRIFSLFLIWF